MHFVVVVLVLVFCWFYFCLLLLFFVFKWAILSRLTVPQFVFAVCACMLCFAFVYGLFCAVVVVAAAAVAAVIVVVFVLFVCCSRFSLKKGLHT